MRVVILPEVYDYFENLVEILYKREYFGFRASARGYVAALVDDIRDTLPNRPHRPAPRRAGSTPTTAAKPSSSSSE